MDQTALSLHPFYRWRLSTAFAVRRRIPDGKAVEIPYGESTTLSEYAQKRPGFPRMIFCAAAELSGPSKTPPGRRAASFTFSDDWVGGPQLGWINTKALETNVPDTFKGDLTVLGAMAISGSAFASAMGSQARVYQTLLAISNARLGSWLPNPSWLAGRHGEPDWRQPRMPLIRRVTYFFREILGRYSDEDRLLLITDGGNYDNLGLVEGLRQRSRTVIVVDASGDSPPLATTLADAVTLARDELGVTIELDDPYQLVPGSGAQVQPATPLARLNARLSADVVTSGRITYPEEFRTPGEIQSSDQGTLIVVKSRLTSDMSYDLLSYANSNPDFPYDSTTDQWFDHGQFDGYHQLGTYLGHAAVKRLRDTTSQTKRLDGSLVPGPGGDWLGARLPGSHTQRLG